MMPWTKQINVDGMDESSLFGHSHPRDTIQQFIGVYNFLIRHN